MKKKQKKALYGEAGSFFIDIAKYITTGALITTLLSDFQEHNIAIYLLGIISIVSHNVFHAIIIHAVYNLIVGICGGINLKNII